MMSLALCEQNLSQSHSSAFKAHDSPRDDLT